MGLSRLLVSTGSLPNWVPLGSKLGSSPNIIYLSILIVGISNDQINQTDSPKGLQIWNLFNDARFDGCGELDGSRRKKSCSREYVNMLFVLIDYVETQLKKGRVIVNKSYLPL